MPLVQLFTVSFTKMHTCHPECFLLFKKSICGASLPSRFAAASFFSFLSFLPGAPLRASILFFRQSSFYPCSVWCPPVGSAFHHPACSQETPVALGRPAVSLITHVTCSRRALASGRGKHEATLHPQRRREGRFLFPCRLYQNARPSTMRLQCLASMKWPTMAGNQARNSETHRWEMRCLRWVTCCEWRRFI